MRLDQLSPSFHMQVLKLLPWWQRPKSVLKEHAIISALFTMAGPALTVNSCAPAAQLDAPRKADVGTGRQEWQVCGRLAMYCHTVCDFSIDQQLF